MASAPYTSTLPPVILISLLESRPSEPASMYRSPPAMLMAYLSLRSPSVLLAAFAPSSEATTSISPLYTVTVVPSRPS